MTDNFSMIGGPFHRWACRTGLVRGGTDSTAFGFVLGATLWLVLLAVAYADGMLGEIFVLSKVSGHVRLLVVIPLLFWAESLAFPRIASWIRMLVASGLVGEAARPAFDALLARVDRARLSWIPDLLSLTVAVTIALTAEHLPLTGTTAGTGAAGRATATALWWYWIAILTLFRFLMARWVWRLLLWTYLLWRVARLDLRMVPTHPDGTAGLRSLETVQMHFAPFVLALSAVQSASIAEELSVGSMTLEETIPTLAFAGGVDFALFYGPMLFFFPKLWHCRVQGLGAYMQLASDYVRGFDRKWVAGSRPTDEDLLGTPDLQSLADLNNSIAIVRNLQMVPAGRKLFIVLGTAAVVPLVPLLLFEYPLSELAAAFFSRLTGF